MYTLQFIKGSIQSYSSYDVMSMTDASIPRNNETQNSSEGRQDAMKLYEQKNTGVQNVPSVGLA